MDAVTICGESSAHIEARLTARDQKEDRGCEDRTGQLSSDVGEQLGRRKPLCNRQSNGYRRVEVTPGDVADRVSHSQDREAERQGYAQQANTYIGKRGGKNCAAAAPKNQPECAE